ncbi:MAG: Ig-like domain-containing protein, partial [Calditrichaceae bacterium]
QINPNVFTQLVTLLPGEQILPGDTENDPLKTPGKRSKATNQTSGLAFPVDVYAMDDYWNWVPTAPEDQVRLFTTDSAAVIVPVNSNLSEGKSSFSVTLKRGGNQILRAFDDSNTNIRTSLDAQVEVLVGGLHYEVVIDEESVAAGDPFQMEIFFKNQNNETITSANHVVHLSIVDASNLTEVSGDLQFTSIDLQNGHRALTQTCTAVGMIKIKIEDDLDGTDPAYSDPLEVLAGSVAAINIESEKTELRALEDLLLTVQLSDMAENPVANKEVKFSVISGTGVLSDTSKISDEDGQVTVEFTAGRVTENDTIRASVDSVYTDFAIVVNLTPSSLKDGVPINFPNPFGVNSDVTHIEYFLPENADVSLKIYDLFGNLVWSKEIAAGNPGGLGRELVFMPIQ